MRHTQLQAFPSKSSNSKEKLIFITSLALSGPWEYLSMRQLLTFKYADGDLTLSQVLWHKISRSYPSTQVMYYKKHEITQRYFKDISLCPALHAGHTGKQRLDTRTRTCTNTQECFSLLSVQGTINNHLAATRAQQFMHEEDAGRRKMH